jgi:hypothetical protein
MKPRPFVAWPATSSIATCASIGKSCPPASTGML